MSHGDHCFNSPRLFATSGLEKESDHIAYKGFLRDTHYACRKYLPYLVRFFQLEPCR